MKDLFSNIAADYASYRPRYPGALIEFIINQCPAHTHAWDCATGNGQVACQLADHFTHVTGTDISANQLANAHSAPNITYTVAPAEQSGLAHSSLDLITVAQALHWFDRDRFFTEVRRVSKPGAILAFWCYNLLHVSKEIDQLVATLYDGILDGYWQPERKLVDDNYQSIAVPFERINTPSFDMNVTWTFEQFVGYLRTWSGVQDYIKKNKSDPLAIVIDELQDAWGNDTARTVLWVVAPHVYRVR